MIKKLTIVLIFSITTAVSVAQTKINDSYDINVQKYADKAMGKMQAYEKRVTAKTEKTLQKLSHWENKIRVVLKKVNPEAESRLFAGNAMTFSSLLEKIKKGEEVANGWQSMYDGYFDTLSTTLRYLKQEESKGNDMVSQAVDKTAAMEHTISRTEYISSFIKERKKQLLTESKNYISRRLIAKASKEEYYYIASLKNYKGLFSDKSKTETFVKKALTEIPAFKEFIRKNSLLASLFRVQERGGGSTASISLAGLQTRAGVQDIIQQRLAAGGPNASAQLQQNLSEAQTKLSELKDKLLKGGVMGSGGEVEMPDFKPNAQKSKTLWQRLEYGFDVQFSKNNIYLPSTADLGINLGYRLSDKSVFGAGISYRLGMGSIEHIKLSSQGIGLKSFLDWKIKGQFYISGGYEMNYNNAFEKVEVLKNFDSWQRSALFGLSKKYKINKKLKGEIKLLYDFLARQHVPASAPFMFRVGYKM